MKDILKLIDENWFQFCILISLIFYLFLKADSDIASNIVSAFIGCISGIKISNSIKNENKN